MSFILDALKKSEAERQRQSSPNLMDSGMAPRRRGLPLWAIILCLLLGLNVIVLGIMLIRLQLSKEVPHAAATGTATRATPPVQAPQATPDDSHFSPMDSAPVYAPEITVDTPAAPVARRGRIDPALTTGAITVPNVARNAFDSGAADDELLPEISELNLTGSQALPDLHLDVHVYATTPADRFVYINMRKYREGAVLQEGLTLERIRRDGVVLNYQGLRFLLPRR
jgi:general secretion pathway protein B